MVFAQVDKVECIGTAHAMDSAKGMLLGYACILTRLARDITARKSKSALHQTSWSVPCRLCSSVKRHSDGKLGVCFT